MYKGTNIDPKAYVVTQFPLFIEGKNNMSKFAKTTIY